MSLLSRSLSTALRAGMAQGQQQNGTILRAMSSGVDGLDIQISEGVQTITFNRPAKLNSFTRDMFVAMPRILEEAAENPDTKVVVLSGTGKYYSSGNDLGNLAVADKAALAKMVKEGRKELQNFVAGFIDFPKPLIACINGPAIGIACTSLPLCDAVYASDRAWFQTPFIKIGQAPEGCSSYLFPKIMGHANASEVLLFGKKFTAQEAKTMNLVSEVYPHVVLEDEVRAKALQVARLPPLALAGAKKVVRDSERAKLHEVNEQECLLLEKLWSGDECFNAVMSFVKKTKK